MRVVLQTPLKMANSQATDTRPKGNLVLNSVPETKQNVVYDHLLFLSARGLQARLPSSRCLSRSGPKLHSTEEVRLSPYEKFSRATG
jgi:hypothetical protein